MKVGKRKDPYSSHYGMIEVPDDLEICDICGEDIWPGEAVAWDGKNRICHAECMEKEFEDGT